MGSELSVSEGKVRGEKEQMMPRTACLIIMFVPLLIHFLTLMNDLLFWALSKIPRGSCGTRRGRNDVSCLYYCQCFHSYVVLVLEVSARCLSSAVGAGPWPMLTYSPTSGYRVIPPFMFMFILCCLFNMIIILKYIILGKLPDNEPHNVSKQISLTNF